MRSLCVLLGLCLTTHSPAQQMPTSNPSSQPSTAPTSQSFDPGAEEAAALALDPTPSTAPTSFLFQEPKLYPIKRLPTRSSPSTASFLALVPGLGHAYLGEYGEAAGYGGSMLGLRLILEVVTTVEPEFNGQTIGLGMQNLWFYNIFDAYRDARRKQKNYDYKTPVTNESLLQLVTAPFRPDVLRKKWVWAGVPAALVGGFGVSLLAERALPETNFSLASLRPTPKPLPGLGIAKITSDDLPILLAGGAFLTATFVPVGVGEEALFRGVLQSSLVNRMGPINGWIAASLLFGSVHIFNFVEVDPITERISGFNEAGYFAVPYITLVGAGFGYAYMKENDKLSASVAAHFWYDFLLSVPAIFALANAEPATIRFSFRW
jgi:membrane protease YdiL (CAAX protease family)